jgi:diguanylate cyclase (GGDEF)-like protein/PAS domain S-box-containing protein
MESDERKTKSELLEELHRLRRRIADLETRIADSTQTEKAIRASESRYRRIFEAARDGILILDANTGRITDINPFLIEILGFSREELLGRRLWETGPLKDHEDLDSPEDALGELLNSGSVRYEALPLKTKNGQRIGVEFVSEAYRVDNKKVIQCSIRDVTECRKVEEELRYLGTHDELTGLHNRMFFEEEMLRLGRGRQFPITIVVAEVDGLKRVNDTLGHAVGDGLLKRAASVMKETFRADEIVARIGGDEFVALLPKTGETTAQMALDRARNRLHSHNSAQTGPPLSLSLGAATAKTSQSLAEALRQADEHMCAEKAVHKLERLSPLPRDPRLIFKQIDATLSARPGIHISKLASELACERHVIERAVKVVKSMQFREYQQMRKLETAHRLLAEKPLLIKQIAGALGYTSPTSLWRLFKTRMRKSPSEIRASESRISASSSQNEDLEASDPGGSGPAG